MTVDLNSFRTQGQISHDSRFKQFHNPNSKRSIILQQICQNSSSNRSITGQNKNVRNQGQIDLWHDNVIRTQGQTTHNIRINESIPQTSVPRSALVTLLWEVCLQDTTIAPTVWVYPSIAPVDCGQASVGLVKLKIVLELCICCLQLFFCSTVADESNVKRTTALNWNNKKHTYRKIFFITCYIEIQFQTLHVFKLHFWNIISNPVTYLGNWLELLLQFCYMVTQKWFRWSFIKLCQAVQEELILRLTLIIQSKLVTPIGLGWYSHYRYTIETEVNWFILIRSSCCTYTSGSIFHTWLS